MGGGNLIRVNYSTTINPKLLSPVPSYESSDQSTSSFS